MHAARTAGHGWLEAVPGSLDQGGVRTRGHADGTLLAKFPSNREARLQFETPTRRAGVTSSSSEHSATGRSGGR
jgi:hypothetical protein